jgi:hypothetical protein
MMLPFYLTLHKSCMLNVHGQLCKQFASFIVSRYFIMTEIQGSASIRTNTTMYHCARTKIRGSPL